MARTGRQGRARCGDLGDVEGNAGHPQPAAKARRVKLDGGHRAGAGQVLPIVTTCREFIAAARGAIGAPAATGTGILFSIATILAGSAAAAAAAAAAGALPPPRPPPPPAATSPPPSTSERWGSACSPPGPRAHPARAARGLTARRQATDLLGLAAGGRASALALIIVAVGGFLIYRNTTGQPPRRKPAAPPRPAQTGWQLGAASLFPAQAAGRRRCWTARSGWPVAGRSQARERDKDLGGSTNPGEWHQAVPGPVCRSRASRDAGDLPRSAVADRWFHDVAHEPGGGRLEQGADPEREPLVPGPCCIMRGRPPRGGGG